MTESSLSLPSEESMPKQPELRRKSPLYLLFHALATMTSGVCSVSIKQLLIPIQVGLIDPTTTNTSFTLVASLGALTGLLTSPITGALSDRTASRLGRRRLWIIIGLVVAVSGMMLMSAATTIPLLLAGEMLAQIGVNTLLPPITALLPEQVPSEQRSLLAACVGAAPNVGGVVGLLLITHFTDTHIVAQGYYILIAVSLVCVGLFLLVLREQPCSREELPAWNFKQFLASFIHPLAFPDFRWTLISRCFVYLGLTLLNSYLFFFLTSAKYRLPVPIAASQVAIFQLIATVVLGGVAVLTGIIAQRVQVIKPFVTGGAALMALGFTWMVVAPQHSFLIAAVIYGAGFGLYIGVDLSLVVKVLPSADARGKDLAIMYVAIYLPLVLSTIIGGSLLNLTHNNYDWLFTVATASCTLAGICIVPIKSVR